VQEERRKGIINFPVVDKPPPPPTYEQSNKSTTGIIGETAAAAPAKASAFGSLGGFGGGGVGTGAVQFSSSIFKPGAAFTQSTPLKVSENTKAGGILSALSGTTNSVTGATTATGSNIFGAGSSIFGTKTSEESASATGIVTSGSSGTGVLTSLPESTSLLSGNSSLQTKSTLNMNNHYLQLRKFVNLEKSIYLISLVEK
jgi:hypothetical protein